MSAIAGIWRLDGGLVESGELNSMAHALRQHGPDRCGSLLDGSIGLLHLLMLMTPEDEFEQQPWRGEGDAVIVADLRLDDREGLLARLNIMPQSAASWPDSRILLAAWRRFGDAIWPSLRGAFAVAIWEPKTRILTLARDHFGHRVLMWHRSARGFAFATMPKGLFALDDVPRDLNEEKFADFLVLNHSDQATTVWRNIHRIPPAHVMQVLADGSITLRRYWSVSDVPRVRVGSDQEYADGLRDCLERAVRRQLRTMHPVGCFLSGGLDSSSVATLASRALVGRQRLAAFTHVPREGFDGKDPLGRFGDETPFVEAIREFTPNLDVTYLREDALEQPGALDRYFDAIEGPIRNPTNLGWMLAILRLAAQQGRRVMLTGAHGNFTISWPGWTQAANHLAAFRIGTAFRILQQHYRTSTGTWWDSFQRLFAEPLMPRWAQHWAMSRSLRGEPWADYAAIRKEFAAEMGVAERARHAGHDFLYRATRNERMESVLPLDYAGDSIAASVAFCGVELRDPTADVDVVAFCFGVPPEQYLVENIDRSLIRRAMWGRLPEVVLANKRVGLQSADWYEKLQQQRNALVSKIAALRANPRVSRTIDLDRLMRDLRDWPEGGWHTGPIYSEYGLALPRAFAAARFLTWLEGISRREPQ